jgi:N-hydroxyarylamine O-acetyltransferase
VIIDTYLKRINIDGRVHADLQSLCYIQENHLLSVPFENLNIMYCLPIQLELERLYDKIVRHRRGGYCHELNGLLSWLLRSVGYRVSILSSRVLRNDGTYGPEFGHMLLLVHLDEDYIVDVGFGDSVRSPLPLTGEIVEDVSGSYRVVHDCGSDELLFQKKLEGEWVSELRFTLTPRAIEDFREMNDYQQSSPDSHFTKNVICSIATPDGRLSISGQTFIQTTSTGKGRSPIASDEERIRLLKSYFGIERGQFTK